MTLPTYRQTLTTFVTSTADAHSKVVVDQIWQANMFMAFMAAHREPQVGGKRVFIPVEYGKNTTITRALGRGSTLPLKQDEIITECEYNWHTYGGSVIRYRDDDLENSGKYAIYNKLQAELRNMINAFHETIEEDLLSDESTGSAKFCGIEGLIEDVTNAAADTSITAGSKTVGNLSRATYPWWTNFGRDMSGLDVNAWLPHYMREGCNNVEAYTGRLPEAIVTHFVVRDFYEDQIGKTLRTMDVNMGDIGYKTVEWKGIPFVTSYKASQSRMNFVGKDTIKLIYEPRLWFKNTGWKEPVNQPWDYARQTLAKGQMTIKKPNGTSVVYGINES